MTQDGDPHCDSEVMLVGVFDTQEDIIAEIMRRESIFDAWDPTDGTPPPEVLIWEGADCVVEDLLTGERWDIDGDYNWEQIRPPK
jgi:hypothetical protein